MHKEYILQSIFGKIFINVYFLTSLETFSSQQTVKVLFQLCAGLRRWSHCPDGHLIFLSQPPQFCSLPSVDIPRSNDTGPCEG